MCQGITSSPLRANLDAETIMPSWCARKHLDCSGCSQGCSRQAEMRPPVGLLVRLAVLSVLTIISPGCGHTHQPGQADPLARPPTDSRVFFPDPLPRTY